MCDPKTICYRLTEEEFAKATDNFRRQGKKNYLICFLFFLGLIAFVNWQSRPSDGFDLVITNLTIIPSIIIVIYILNRLGKKKTIKNFRNSPFSKLDLTTEWDNAALSIRHSNGFQRYEWVNFRGWSEDQIMLTLFFGPNLYIPLPKRAFNDGQEADLKSQIRSAGLKELRLMPF
ncbi:YcxB family protein [Agrobacterium rosae]|uniref:YcxB family protein n=1 Tax=Agrobacterium rosae TaxID=1972867 RepID=UPI0019D3CC96|nr:YcxB family protein [Agrobacterium rosae]MBN7805949.1 YcxB family protein [Agrobacterium rosae]